MQETSGIAPHWIFEFAMRPTAPNQTKHCSWKNHCNKIFVWYRHGHMKIRQEMFLPTARKSAYSFCVFWIWFVLSGVGGGGTHNIRHVQCNIYSMTFWDSATPPGLVWRTILGTGDGTGSRAKRIFQCCRHRTLTQLEKLPLNCKFNNVFGFFFSLLLCLHTLVFFNRFRRVLLTTMGTAI